MLKLTTSDGAKIYLNGLLKKKISLGFMHTNYLFPRQIFLTLQLLEIIFVFFCQPNYFINIIMSYITVTVIIIVNTVHIIITIIIVITIIT